MRERTLASVFVLLLVTATVAPFAAAQPSFTGEVQLNGNPAANGTTYTYDLTDLDDASTPKIEFTGRTAVEWDNVSATSKGDGSTMSIDVGGDLEPTGPASGAPRAVFTGVEQTASFSTAVTDAADGDTKSISVGGNVDPSSESVIFTGVEQTTTATVSATNKVNGGTFTHTVDGNVPAESGSVTFNGDTQTTKADKTGSGSSGDSDSTSVSGNIDPTSEELTVTAKQHKLINTTNKDTITLKSSASAATVVEFNATVKDVDNDGYNEDVGLGIDNGTTEIKKDILVDSGTTQSFTFSVTLEPGSTVKVGVMDGRYDSVGSGSSSVNMLDAGAKVDGSAPDVTINSATYDFGDLSAGTTATKSVSLTTGSNTLEFGGYGASDYNLSWTENTAAEDPSIDVDGDGTTDFSYTGTLADGQTASGSVGTIAIGSKTGSVSLAAGQTDVDLSYAEITASEDPGLDLDGDGTTDASYAGILRSGETTTVSADTLTQGSVTLTASMTAGTVDYNLSATERTHTEDPALDLDGDGTSEASASGIISPGTTVTAQLDELTTGSTSATVQTTAGVSDIRVELEERQRSVDPAVIINGNRVGYAGSLNESETVALDGSTTSLQTGTNTVEVQVGESLSADDPAPTVGLSYRHNATDKINATYSSEKWSERYSVSKTFNSSQNSVTVRLPHSSDIVAVRNLEYQVNGGGWQELTSQAYELNGSTVVADLGSVSAGDTVEVRDAASKVRVHNGDITVEEPTEPGQRLDTAIRINSWASDSYIAVGGTVDGEKVHYAYNESWTAPEDHTVFRADGTQQVRLPKASDGSLARISTVPVSVAPGTGDVRVDVESPSRTEPEFYVKPGPGGSGQPVQFTYLSAKDDTKYLLWSQTNEIVRDSGTADSPITLEDDDSKERLQFLIDDGGSSTGPGGDSSGVPGSLDEVASGAVSAGATLGDVGILVIVAGLIAGAWFLSREFGEPLSWQTLVIAEAAVVGMLSLELVSQYSFVGGVAFGIGQLGKFLGMGLMQAAPLALLVFGVLGYLAIRRWGRPQVVVNRSFTIGGEERGKK